MGRAILAVVAGCVLSLLIVSGVEAVGHMIYPPPAGIDVRDPAAMRIVIAEMAFGAFVIIVSGWILGAGLGAWLATRLSGTGKTWPGGAVGGVTLAATGINLLAIAHPLWIVIVALIGIPLATWVGVRVGQTTASAMTTARAA
jgi:hypothetical protein